MSEMKLGVVEARFADIIWNNAPVSSGDLVKLAENYEVEWWTEREIFTKLRRNFYLIERYRDIVEVI